MIQQQMLRGSTLKELIVYIDNFQGIIDSLFSLISDCYKEMTACKNSENVTNLLEHLIPILAANAVFHAAEKALLIPVIIFPQWVMQINKLSNQRRHHWVWGLSFDTAAEYVGGCRVVIFRIPSQVK